MSFYIGNVKIDGQIIVAPMAGISNKCVIFMTFCLFPIDLVGVFKI